MPDTIYQFYTYIYYDPDTLQPFLVGKGFGKRYKFHLTCSLKASKNPHKFYKIRKIHNSGKHKHHKGFKCIKIYFDGPTTVISQKSEANPEFKI
jgi:hypothetical protein